MSQPFVQCYPKFIDLIQILNNFPFKALRYNDKDQCVYYQKNLHELQVITSPTESDLSLLKYQWINFFKKEKAKITITDQFNRKIHSKIILGSSKKVGTYSQFINIIDNLIQSAKNDIFDLNFNPIKIEITHTHITKDLFTFKKNTHGLQLNSLSKSDCILAKNLSKHFLLPVILSAITPNPLKYTIFVNHSLT